MAGIVLLYHPALSHSFIDYDDGAYVTANQHVRQGLTWETVKWSFQSTEHSNWHPLTWLSHALDVQFFALNPAGHHATNVGLHALNSILLFLLALYATGRFGPSLLLALLFAVHPINVESVAWVAERKNMLSTLFLLLTVCAYGWYARRSGWKRLALVMLLFACGLMAKPMLVTLPFALLLLDYWPLNRIGQTTFGKLIAEKLPLFLLSLISSVVTFRVQQAGHAIRSATQFPFVVRLENALVSYALYSWKAIWPADLALFYPHPGASIAIWRVMAATVLFFAITGIVCVFRKQKYLVTGWLWFLGTMVPVIGVVQVGDQALADRYAYVPFIGLFLIVSWAAWDLLASKKFGGALAIGLSSILISTLAFQTHRQLAYWSNNLSLWSHTLAVTHKNAFAHTHMAWAMGAANDTNGALEQFRDAISDGPDDALNYTNFGLYLQGQNRLKEAIEQYQKATTVARDADQLAGVYTGLGAVYQHEGYCSAAIEIYEKALAVNPSPEQRAVSYTNLGAAYDQSGNYRAALASYNEALHLNPQLYNTLYDRGLVLERMGDVERAIEDYHRSIEIQPEAQTYLQMSRALLRLNRTSEAQSSFRKASELASE